MPGSKRTLSIALILLGTHGLTHAWANVSPQGRVCNPRQFGARADGVTKDTAAIQAAIDACAGGGSVELQDGTFLSGMIVLRSDLHFVIAPTATLKGTQDDADYPAQNPPTNNSQLSNCRKALIYAEGAQNLFIEGGGTIDGNGNTPKWLGPASVHPERTRPMAIFIVQSTGVTIQNVQVKDAAMWAVVNMESDNITINGVNIHSPLSGTRDGIDLVDCHHALIENSTIFSEDDSICLKSGNARGIQDVTVRDCTVLQSSVANGLKLGTASSGSFRDVTFEDITVTNVDKAAMAVESVDGAEISNVVFRGIHFHRAGTAVFVLLGKRGNPTRVGSIDGVTFENIEGDQLKHSWGSAISGTRIGNTVYPVKNVAFRNVQVAFQGGLAIVPKEPPEYDGRYPDPNLWGNLPAAAYFVRHAEGVTFDQCTTRLDSPDARRPSVLLDVSE